jgi:alcohol dehydrogenase
MPDTPPHRQSAGSAQKTHAGLIRVMLTTMCGTDLHIVRGEYPVRPGLIIGHEPVGVIEEFGPGVVSYQPRECVLVGAITPCGQYRACLSGQLSQCGARLGYKAIGGWRFGNTIHGAPVEYLLYEFTLDIVPGLPR